MPMMKWLTIAALASALAALPAHAQMAGKRPHDKSEKQSEKKTEVDEKAYKAALEKIPEPKEKYDPWSGARPAEPAKKK
jgi:hypothetical protein